MRTRWRNAPRRRRGYAGAHARAHQGLLRRDPRRRHRQQAVAAVPCRRPQVPARPHRLRPLAAARHLGPPRAALRARPHRGRHRPRAPRGGREGAARHPRQERLPRVRAARLGGRDRARRRDPRRVASPTSSSAPSPPTTSSAAPRCSTGRCSRRSRSRARATSARSASRRPSRPSASATCKKAGELVVDGAPEAALVERFVEKPDLDTASEYFADRSYLWNAGMFISRADVLLGEIAENQPQLLRRADGPRRGRGTTATRAGPVVDRVWPTITKIAIDYAVAEPAAAKGRLAVIPGHFDWDDVGDFASLAKLNSHGRRQRPRDPRRERADPRRCRPAASSSRQTQPGHQRDRRARTSSSSTPRTRCWSPRASTRSA